MIKCGYCEFVDDACPICGRMPVVMASRNEEDTNVYLGCTEDRDTGKVSHAIIVCGKTEEEAAHQWQQMFPKPRPPRFGRTAAFDY